MLRGNIQPWDGRKPAWGYACQGEPCSVHWLWRPLIKILWEQISRTTQTTLPNRLRSGPKVPSQVLSDRTEAYLAKWSNPFPQQYSLLYINTGALIRAMGLMTHSQPLLCLTLLHQFESTLSTSNSTSCAVKFVQNKLYVLVLSRSFVCLQPRSLTF